MPLSIPANETNYERVQRFNLLTRWLHSRRYVLLLGIAKRLARETPGRPLRIADIGCGVAKVYGFLNERLAIEYVGIDHDPEFCRVAAERYGTNPNFRVLCASADDPVALAQVGQPDLVCALETLEHIPEPVGIRIVGSIAALRPRLFVASVPVEVGPAAWIKHLGSMTLGYRRHLHRRADEVFWAGLYQTHRLPPHQTGHSGWDWRWLGQTIRHYMRIREVRKAPLPFLPAGLSFSVIFLAEPRPERPGQS